MKRLFSFLSISLFTTIFAVGTIAEAQHRRRSSPAQKPPTTYSDSYSYSSYTSTHYENEVQAGLTVGHYSSQNSMTNIQARGSYAKLIQTQLQIGGELTFSSMSGSGNSSTTFGGFGFASYNFDTNLDSAFYAKGGLGLFSTTNSAGDSESKFGFMAGGGKRFPLWDRITYNPELRLFKVGDLDPYFEAIFLNLSIMF